MEAPDPFRDTTRTSFPLLDRILARPEIGPVKSNGADAGVSPGTDTAAATTQSVYLELLRAFSVHLQDFRDLLTSVTTGDASLDDYRQYSTDWVAKGDAFLTRIEDELTRSAIPVDDGLTRMQQRWSRVKLSPLLKEPPKGALSQDQLRQLRMLDNLCRSIVFDIGWLTIPQRLNGWLAGARPGYYIAFHQIFADEIPDEQDRVKMLAYLAAAPRAINGGLINRGNGLIYRYSSHLPLQLLTLFGVIAALALATWLVVALCRVGSPGVDLGFATIQAANWPLTEANIPAILAAWAALLAGIAVHLAVGSAKRMRANPTEPPVLSAYDALPVINAKFGPILLKLFTALLGLFAIVATQGVAAATPFTAFLFGYSLDSVVGLVGSSLEERAAAQTAVLGQKLGG